MGIISSVDIFNRIIGLKITYASNENGVVTLIFDKVWTLCIYNSISILSNNLLAENIDISSVINYILKGAVEIDSKFVISLSNSISLIVDLSDKGFTGPEAMQLVGPDNLYMVWS